MRLRPVPLQGSCRTERRKAVFYSLRNRLIAIFVLLFVLAFCTMSILIFNQSRSIIRSYIESSALEKMDEYGSYISMVQTQVYDLASIVFNSDTAKNWDALISDPDAGSGEKNAAHYRMSQFLTQTTNSYTSVSSVTVYRREGMWVSSGNQVVFDQSLVDKPWYQDLIKRYEYWVPAQMDEAEMRNNNPHPVIGMLMPIGSFEPANARSIMKVNVTADYFLDPLERIHLGAGGSIYLLDQDGQPMLSQTEYNAHENMRETVDAVRAGSGKQGVVYVTSDQGDKEILVYKKLAKTNWMLVGFVSEKDLYAPLMKLRNTIFILATVLIVLSLLLATWLSHGITKPLSRLITAMRYVERGDFEIAESRIPAANFIRNEIDYASSTFRQMVVRLRRHIKDEFELKLLRQQAEYKTLLMQINPHFLFNTLELMSSLAMQKRTDDTVEVIESLGKMMRFSLRINEDLIRLDEELKYVRYYVSILHIRFGDKVNIDIDEEDVGQLVIIKFILQPLIENAVKYSFESGTEARVRIGVRRERGSVRLTVSDKGPGMPEKLRRQLVEQSVRAELDYILNNNGGQVGLGNVLARCRLYYGSLFDVRIEAGEDGTGTTIELILPEQEEQRHV
ncbi:cache domain-containing sensor histidine kinase [Paenibacillus harenae]|uniref:cache domain-containing sensor histidine kinase n=1 Tax=Paenibacillus harenae TaxID=306543 RepID=UPI00278E428D|nr:sensor histidine kinase [Paenibacillus harenae]MDQ0059063.1 two-component system sensor histidine kinase YesM [Paenibacillus harenae]